MYGFLVCLLAVATICSARTPANNDNSVCTQRIEQGFCYGYFERYAYNTTAEQCQFFVYGGCSGNDNNFNTLEECQDLCESSC